MTADDSAPEIVPPRGKARRWSDKQLEALSAITPDDIAKAREAWKAVAPAKFRSLLDAHD
jgi:hypothetical protein